MHKGRRIKIPVIEETSHKWKKVANLNDLSLEGRPTKVLTKFIDTGIDREWWTGRRLRESEAFKKLVVIAFGQVFWDKLVEMRRKKYGEEKSG